MVHPHACGEYGRRCDGVASGTRFTRTRVGNTPFISVRDSSDTVHPHACGEYGYAPGSSRCRPVHPHACGEYHPEGSEDIEDFGSPPRVWGILLQFSHEPAQYRFTPTRVGNTLQLISSSKHVYGSPPRVWGIPRSASWKCTDHSVHPHACGEYIHVDASSYGLSGSPPRVWGILAPASPPPLGNRFTPTRVGNTPMNQTLSRGTPVHPHACGEYVTSWRLLMLLCGSPPRVWGIRTIHP